MADTLTDFERSLAADTLDEYLAAMTRHIQQTTGCDHAGIRIRDNEGNIPYAALIGFENEDWQSTEPHLNVYRDSCACTRINEGMLDPYEESFTTAGGSFHIGAIEDFTSGLDEHQATRYIGKCMAMGISSVALVPLIHNGTITGNIHVAGMEPNTITREMVTDLEDVAPFIARRIGETSAQ